MMTLTTGHRCQATFLLALLLGLADPAVSVSPLYRNIRIRESDSYSDWRQVGEPSEGPVEIYVRRDKPNMVDAAGLKEIRRLVVSSGLWKPYLAHRKASQKGRDTLRVYVHAHTRLYTWTDTHKRGDKLDVRTQATRELEARLRIVELRPAEHSSRWRLGQLDSDPRHGPGVTKAYVRSDSEARFKRWLEEIPVAIEEAAVTAMIGTPDGRDRFLPVIAARLKAEECPLRLRNALLRAMGALGDGKATYLPLLDAHFSRRDSSALEAMRALGGCGRAGRQKAREMLASVADVAKRAGQAESDVKAALIESLGSASSGQGSVRQVAEALLSEDRDVADAAYRACVESAPTDAFTAECLLSYLLTRAIAGSSTIKDVMDNVYRPAGRFSRECKTADILALHGLVSAKKPIRMAAVYLASDDLGRIVAQLQGDPAFDLARVLASLDEMARGDGAYTCVCSKARRQAYRIRYQCLGEDAATRGPAPANSGGGGLLAIPEDRLGRILTLTEDQVASLARARAAQADALAKHDSAVAEQVQRAEANIARISSKTARARAQKQLELRKKQLAKKRELTSVTHERRAFGLLDAKARKDLLVWAVTREVIAALDRIALSADQRAAAERIVRSRLRVSTWPISPAVSKALVPPVARKVTDDVLTDEQKHILAVNKAWRTFESKPVWP